MKVPVSFKIGHKGYEVSQPYTISPLHACNGGLCNVYYKKMLVAHNVQGRPMTERRRAQVFWHETMHAILHDMDHKQWRDEAFVEGLAKRITDVVYSVRF